MGELAIIPARGGSKRIPGKNLKKFAGKPMIAHAIETARASELFDHVIVSTDDPEIADVAVRWGAETPFVRPGELSDDHAATSPVVTHAIGECEAFGWKFDLVCCIYPCVPLLLSSDLVTTMQLLRSTAAKYVFPIVEYESAIQRALRRDQEGRVTPYFPDYQMTRTQDLEPAFHDAGQFYWAGRETWLNYNTPHRGGLGYVMPRSRVVDIDSQEDWKIAEILYRHYRENPV